MDDILEECGAAVIDYDNPKVVFTGLGNKTFSPVFKTLKRGQTIDNNIVDSIVMDNLEGFDPEHKETIGQRVLILTGQS